jgi:SAM-dependent methyltransferase
VGGDDIQAAVSEETHPAGAGPGQWHAQYLGSSYRFAVEMALAAVERRPLAVLKTDLWNEVLGGTRDIASHFREEYGWRFFGIDLEHEVCVLARSRVSTVHVVQADIRALPFRAGSFDAVLDLSTLDHVPEAGAAHAIGEYRRVLRDRGVLLVIFWQRNFLMRLRLFLKRLLGRREKPDQQYFTRAAVRAVCREGFVVIKEFATGSLLVPPHPVTSFLLRMVPARALARFVRSLVDLEYSDVLRPVLKHLAGLYGIAALRREDVRDGKPDAVWVQAYPRPSPDASGSGVT